MSKNSANRMEHSKNRAMERTVKPARTLEHTYWADEGDAAVRWLIGKINYGPYQEVRDDLRKAPLSEVKAWAEQSRNQQLALVCEQALLGEESSLVRMNPKVGPSDRLVAVAASVLLYPVAKTMSARLVEVVEDHAVFSVVSKGQHLKVVAHPAAIMATNTATCVQEAWLTNSGTSLHAVLNNLLAVG